IFELIPNATFQLAFEGVANYGHGIVIDDVQVDVVQNASTAISKSKTSDIRVYPNPSNGIFTISQGSNGAVAQFEVFNISGVRVQSGVLAKSSEQVDLTRLSEGVYILRLVSKHTEQLMKLIIKK
ncbi:MAG: T9SS type A sorting domain-containing protein, partial [Marinilabiliaceae bacterium]|nr:T9SS type A sorting domain-containing protein [Marinilabiliaceae bacterium]